jgi:hypothetical protein
MAQHNSPLKYILEQTPNIYASVTILWCSLFSMAHDLGKSAVLYTVDNKLNKEFIMAGQGEKIYRILEGSCL